MLMINDKVCITGMVLVAVVWLVLLNCFVLCIVLLKF